jgi:hypothetical protein
MALEEVMGGGGSSAGPPYANAGIVQPGESIVFDGTNSSTGQAIVQEIFGDVDAKIYKELDPNGDRDYEISILIDASTGRFHSQMNQIQISKQNNMRLRIENDHTSQGQFGASGVEVTE